MNVIESDTHSHKAIVYHKAMVHHKATVQSYSTIVHLLMVATSGRKSTWLVERSLMEGVDHDVTGLTLLPTVGPRVSTGPVVAALGTSEFTPHTILALVRSSL